MFFCEKPNLAGRRKKTTRWHPLFKEADPFILLSVRHCRVYYSILDDRPRQLFRLQCLSELFIFCSLLGYPDGARKLFQLIQAYLGLAFDELSRQKLLI